MASGGRTRTTTLFDFGVVRLQKAPSPTDGESDRDDEITDGATAATVLAYHDDDHDHDDDSDDETDISTVAAEVEQQSETPGTDSDECNSDCCKANREQPNQPSSSKVLERTRQVCKHGSKTQTRSVKACWFVQYPWLTLCESRNTLFCFYCTSAHRKKLLFSKRESAFFSSGFSNWKNALDKFAKHESSNVHSEAVSKIRSATTTNVGAVLNTSHRQQQLVRQRMLLKQLQSLRYLVRQGLPMRGHDDKEGNLFQLLLMQSTDDREMHKWLEERKYISPQILNEQVGLMADTLLRSLLEEIRSTPWFAVLADEATDVSVNEQMCIAIRWVNSDYEIMEDPIGLIELPKTDASTLTSSIKDVLIRCMLPLSSCRGQAYDGAANMSGRISGVAARIKSDVPSALHVHCLAHCLNLCLQDSARICVIVRDTLELVIGIVKLIKYSPKRSSLFESLKTQMSIETGNLKPLCPTRWTVRSGAIAAVLANYSVLIATLEEAYETGHDEYAVKAGGYAKQLQLFRYFFGLKFCSLLFNSTEQLSCTLQRKDITVQEARQATSVTKAYLQKQRSDDAFNRFFDNVVLESSNFTEEPTLPRKRKLPRRVDDGAASHQHLTPRDFYRQIYFQGLDIVITEISRRFDQNDIAVVAEIEKLLIDSANGSDCSVPSSVQDMYSADLDMERLSVHLKMLPDVIKKHGESEGIPIRKVTTVRTICDSMNTTPVCKNLLLEVHRLLLLFYTIPVTTSTAERTFSVLRRVKTYLRSSMTQQRLNHVLLLHSHKTRTDAINLVQLAAKFVSVNERRGEYFGTIKY